MPVTGSFRGGLQVGGTLYGAWTGELYTVNQSGETVLFSTKIGSTDRIFIAQNNRATDPHIAIIANGAAYVVLSTAATVSLYSSVDADIGSPNSVTNHLGFFIFGYGNGDLQASALNNTGINTLDVARTESNPDGVLNMFSYNGNLYVMGEKTIEVWGDPINATGFPFTRIGYNIVPGLKTAHAVAGWQPEFGYPPIWVGSDNTVRQLDGFGAKRISTPDLERLIAEVPFASTQLEAFVYIAGAHAFWQLNCETSTDATSWTWVYELSTGSWHERKSFAQPNSKLIRGTPAFDRWLVGSRDSSDLLEMDHTFHEEGGESISASMESGPVKDFPNRQRIKRADFDFTPGVGLSSTDDNEANPTVLIEVSRDGGRTFPLSWVRSLGSIGDYQKRIFVLNAGLSGDEGARWRWTVSDPVPIGFTGGSMDPVEVEK